MAKQHIMIVEEIIHPNEANRVVYAAYPHDATLDEEWIGMPHEEGQKWNWARLTEPKTPVRIVSKCDVWMGNDSRDLSDEKRIRTYHVQYKGHLQTRFRALVVYSLQRDVDSESTYQTDGVNAKEEHLLRVVVPPGATLITGPRVGARDYHTPFGAWAWCENDECSPKPDSKALNSRVWQDPIDKLTVLQWTFKNGERAHSACGQDSKSHIAAAPNPKEYLEAETSRRFVEKDYSNSRCELDECSGSLSGPTANTSYYALYVARAVSDVAG